MGHEPTSDPYKRLFETMLDGSVVLDATTARVLLANKAAAIVFGFGSPEEMVGVNPLDHVPKEDRERVAHMMADSFERDRGSPSEIRIMTKDKRMLWVSASVTIIEHEGKKATLTTVRDMTSEKAKDAALRTAEESKLRLMDAAAESIFVVQDGKMVYVNPAGAAVAGLSQKEMTGLSFVDFVHPDERQALVERYEKLLAGQWFSEFTTVKGIDAKGQTRWAEIREIPYSWQGRPAVMSLVVDITDRVQLEEERKEREERFRTVIENAWDGITILDENYNVIFESPSLARISGYTPGEWMGRPVGQMAIHPDDLAPLLAKIETLKRQPCSVIRDVVVRYQHKDGSWRWIEATGQNLLHDPRVKGLVVNFRDITDRTKTEEELKGSQERFRTLIERATDVVIVLEATGKITYQSPSLERVTGYGPNEWVDRSLSELFIHPDDLPSLVSLLERVLTQPGATFEGVTARYKHKDGSWHPLEASVTNMLQDPKVNGIVANFRDITDRKAAQEALEESEQKFRLLVENSTDLIFSLDTQGNFTYVSPAVERISGYRVDEVIGTSFVRFVVSEDLPALMASFERALAGATEPSEFRAVLKDGTIRHVQTTSRLVIQDGSVVGVTGIMSDITKRKRAEEALRASEERNRLLIDNANEAITVVQDGVLKFVNPKFAQVTGYATGELVPKPFVELVHTDDQQMLAEYYVRRLKGEEVPQAYQFRFLTKAGHTRWAEINAVLFDWEGRPATLGLLSDITERKRAEAEIVALSNAFRATLDPVLILDMEGHVRNTNEAAKRLFETEDLGINVLEYVMPEDRERVAAAMQDLVTSGRAAVDQFNIVTRSGRRVPIEASGSLMLDAAGRPVGIVVVEREITERKKAQEALAQNEAKYRRLFENTQTAIEVISGETGLVVLANEATARMFGFSSPDDLVGIDSMRFLRPEDVGRVSGQMAQVLGDKSWRDIAELQVRTNDGRWLWISGMAVQTEYQGKPALLISLLDITHRKQVEETLRESEEKHRLLTEKMNDVIWTTDINLRMTYISPSVEKMLGFAPEARLRQPPEAQMTPESFARVQELLLEQLELERKHEGDPNRSVKIDMEYYHKDGATVWAENLVSGIRDTNGTLIGFHGVARDISERRIVEQALKLSEERYRLLAENASDIIWVTDASLKITYASPSATGLLGYSLEEITGRSFDKLLTTASLAFMTQVYKDDVAIEASTPGSMGKRTVEIEVVCKDSSTVWLEAAVNAVRDGEGRFAGFQGACRDISERRRAQQALKESEIKYRNLFEHTLLGMEVVDGETGKVVLTNHSMARMFGFKSAADMVGTNPMDYVPSEDLEWVTSQLAQVMADPEKHDVTTIRAKTEDGRIIWVTGSATSFEYEGRPSALLSLIDVTAARQAEAKLHESEEKNRLLIDNAAEGIVVVQDGLLKFVNPKCAEFTGRPAEELISTPFLDIVHPEDRQMMADNHAKRLAGDGTPNDYQFRIIDKQGNTKWLQINAVRFTWEDREATLSMLSDITERVKAEEALRDSEERFRALVERASDAIAVLDAAGKVTYYSPSMERATGYGPGEWVDKSLSDLLIHPDDLPALASHLERILKEPGAAVEDITTRYQHRDGTWHVLEATVRNLLSDPKVNGIVANFRDVTERIRAQESLRDSEERFRGLVETSSDWVWEIDRHGRYTYVSPKVRDILGYEPQELLGHTPYEFMHQREGRRVARIVRRFAEARLPFSLLENTCTHKDGHSVVLETSAVPILENDGSFLGYRGIDRDITERRKVEQELQRSLKRLEKTMESTIEAITTTIETRDPYTTGHQMRVTDLACAIARGMELPPTQIEGIRVAGLMHDIGKIAIPTEILSKPGKLNQVEFSMIQTHAQVGYNILKKIEFAWPVARIVLQHHERWNGSGYPHGIRGEDILLEARILAVADVMEAMASHRPYRPSVGLDKALDEISTNSGILYDPAVAKACETAFTQAGFKFASAVPGVVADSGSTSSDRPVHSQEDR